MNERGKQVKAWVDWCMRKRLLRFLSTGLVVGLAALLAKAAEQGREGAVLLLLALIGFAVAALAGLVESGHALIVSQENLLDVHEKVLNASQARMKAYQEALYNDGKATQCNEHETR